MNLTDLANHICQQCGMTDTDDVSAARMFLQRRLEMIWNSQIWRCSLVEATLTINPDGTCTLADTTWNPSSSTLMLPSVIDSVLAVRADNHAMTVASLESYYRTDTDWLKMQGDPYDFQVLAPLAFDLGQPTNINFAATGDDQKLSVAATVSPDGQRKTSSSITLSATGIFNGITGAGWAGVQQILSASKPPTQNPVILSAWGKNEIIVRNLSATTAMQCTVTDSGGNVTNFTLAPGQSQTFETSISSINVADGSGSSASTSGVNLTGILNITDGPNTSNTPNIVTLATMQPGDTNLPLHQRIRLATQPQVSTNLRILGKGTCPVLADYDTPPINNVEPALMAFARGDLLLRSRQHGKAALAQQEGAALLKQLADSEAFQQANNFRVVPDAGFGADTVLWTQPNSFHPL